MNNSDGMISSAGGNPYNREATSTTDSCFNLCLTEIINKNHGHNPRETRAHSEDGMVEEGSSWVILRNNGVLEKVVASKDPCEEEKYHAANYRRVDQPQRCHINPLQ